MKKIMEMRTVSIIFAMMLVAILSSCSKDDAKEPELNVSMTAINVGSSGGSESISITGNVMSNARKTTSINSARKN